MLEKFQLKIIKQTRTYIFYSTSNEDYEGIVKIEKYKNSRFLKDLEDGITPYQWELLVEDSESK